MDLQAARRILHEARGKIALVASVGNDARNMVNAVNRAGYASEEMNAAIGAIEKLMNAAEECVSRLDKVIG